MTYNYNGKKSVECMCQIYINTGSFAIVILIFLTDMFAHIRGRGTYSMLEGIGAHNQIFQIAKDFGQSSIALTDLYGLYGVVDFYTKSKNFDIKPLLWVEMPYTSHFATLSVSRWMIKQLGTVTLLATDKMWYHNLLRIVSAGYEHTIDDVPCIDSQIIANFAEWILVLIGGLWSMVYTSIVLRNNPGQAKNDVALLSDVIGQDNLVFDITAQSYKDYPELQQVNDFVLNLVKEYDGTMVTSSGYLYPTKSQKWAYETALAIKDGKRNYDPDARKIVWAHHILSELEVRDILQKNKFSDELIDRLIDATGELADRCNPKITLWQALFPNYDTPADIQVIYDAHKDTLLE